MKIQDVRPGETHKQFVLNLFIGFSLLAAISCNNDCRKDHSCVPEYYEFHVDSVKQYFPGKPGSYWVYKNTVNGVIDTVLCLGNYIDTITDKGDYDFSYNVTVRYERLYFQSYSTYFKWSNSYVSNKFYADQRNLRDLPTRFLIEKHIPTSLTVCFFYPFDRVFVAGGYSQVVYTGDTSMKIQNQTYSNLERFHLNYDGTWESEKNRQITYYWARGIGLVKRCSDDGKANWELMDYKIID